MLQNIDNALLERIGKATDTLRDAESACTGLPLRAPAEDAAMKALAEVASTSQAAASKVRVCGCRVRFIRETNTLLHRLVAQYSQLYKDRKEVSACCCVHRKIPDVFSIRT